MNTKKLLLQIIGLTMSIWLLAGCGGAPTEPVPISPTPTNIDFTGYWEDEASAFSLDLSQVGEQLQGSHAVVVQQGNKIDSLDKSIEGNIQGNIAVVQFQSSFTTNSGTAQVTFIDQNTIFWKVTNPPAGEYYLPSEAVLAKKMSAPVASGTITGSVYYMSPPTPKTVVYAVDQTTGEWAFTETEAADGAGSFSIVVPPGTYQVFGEGLGYSIDSLTLTSVTVAANQTVSGIDVRPPSQFECGSMMGYPAAPDGRFAASPGPSAECLASLTPAATTSQAAATRIQFQPNAASWYTPGDLAPGSSIRFVLSAMQGQQMNVNLSTEPAASASMTISGANGDGYTFNPTTSWSNILPVSQDYYIDVFSTSQQNINYQLTVEIPASASVPVSAGSQKIAKDEPIRFAVGPLDVELNGTVISGERDRYSLSMLAGEILDVQITSLEGNAVFSILDPNQVPLPGTEEGKDTMQWAIPIPVDGSYFILVGPTRGNATYTLKVSVSGLP